MSKLSFLVVVFAGLAALPVFANSLVKFPSGPAAWTIDVTPSPTRPDSGPPPGGSRVQKVEVVQNEKFARHLVTYFSGLSRVSWSVAGTSLILTEDPAGTAFLTPTTGFFNIPYLASTFNWINPSLLQEKQPISYGGKLCFHYKGKAGEAWIDSKTLLPVAYDDGSVLASFTFQPAPDTPLVLPSKYQTILDHYIAVMGLPKQQAPPSE